MACQIGVVGRFAGAVRKNRTMSVSLQDEYRWRLGHFFFFGRGCVFMVGFCRIMYVFGVSAVNQITDTRDVYTI